jgi:serine/threonine protein kinase/tetratricopeptide (TPR) repeat protein
MAPAAGRFLPLSCRSDKDDNTRLIHGRYRTLRIIGQGGIARIYLCLDTLTGREAALKIPLDQTPEFSEAIRSEFAFGITHPHPALVGPNALVTEDGLPVMVMPFVDGIVPSENHDKSPFFRSHPECPPRPSIAAILEAAAFIHFSGYIYNDFKPSNFIFQSRHTEDGQSILGPRLLDFNLVARENDTLIRKGTIEYVAPEVLLGRPATPLSDCYSLGATLYELFSGTPPYVSANQRNLIKLITESGAINLWPVPDIYRSGLAAMLSRNPENRPVNMAAAARALGVEDDFGELLSANFGYYLTSGDPPFAKVLKKAVTDYVGGRLEKALLIRGLSVDSGELNSLTVHMTASGWAVERVGNGGGQEADSKILEMVLAEECPDSGCRTMVMVEDFACLSNENRQRLRSLLRASKWHPVIVSASRWERFDFPCQVFDPVFECSHVATTRDVLGAFLKKEPDFDFAGLAETTGGEPEQIYHALGYAVRSGALDIFGKTMTAETDTSISSEIEDILNKALNAIEQKLFDTLGFLAAWGENVPMLLLAGFEDDRREVVDNLIGKKFLRAEKDLLIFSSGNLRRHLYERIPEQTRQEHHLYWAIAAGKFITEDENLSEILAYHLGKSSDSEAGYDANLTAAHELYGKGELGRAGTYAENLLRLSRDGGGPLSRALMLAADIAKQAGDYPSARINYIELLQQMRPLRLDGLRAETLKDLGDLYRSQKRPAKALAYIRRAMRLFERLGDAQGEADCHNNIGLILWVGQDHEKALNSFFSALELDKHLENFHEQAKIYSNIGIIKDILGKTSEVAGYFEAGYLNARKSADPRLEALIANNLGYFHIRQNDLAKAAHYLKEALQISEKIGYIESVINCLGNLGLCSLKAGDLFASIEYNQKAQRMAEEIGNRHLALDAELYLVEVCILMGNFALADKVLGSIERDPVYGENRTFTCQVNLLRARLWRELGVDRGNLSLVTEVRGYAETVGDQRLGLEAALIEAQLEIEQELPNATEKLTRIASEADGLGQYDISDAAGLALGHAHVLRDELSAAEAWIERVYSRPGQTRRFMMEAGNTLGSLRAARGRYDEAISLLMENESSAVGAGFLPLGMEAAVELADVFISCRKGTKAGEALSRAEVYMERIISSLPRGISRDDYCSGRTAHRLVKLLRDISDKELVGNRGGRP